MTAGADAAVVSTHKLISGITQTSVLMARGERLNLARLDGMVHLTQSTSPQVLMYASIDAARAQMATEGDAAVARRPRAGRLGARARSPRCRACAASATRSSQEDGVVAFDRTRLTVSASDLGLTGFELETVLRDDHGIAVEAADPLNVVLNVTYGDSRADVERLVAALRRLRRRASRPGPAPAATAAPAGLLGHAPAFTRQVLSPRDAFFAPSAALPVSACAGQSERRDGHAVSAGHPGPRARRAHLRRDRRLPPRGGGEGPQGPRP